MARPLKDGLGYFPLDTDIFQDKDVQMLMMRYGSDGFALYVYILCATYKDRGYYLQIDDDWECIAARDTGMSLEAVKQVVAYLLGRSLLAKRTINGGPTCKSSTLAGSVDTVTSAGIQRRYQLAVAERARKRNVEVDGRIWLLSDEETEPFIRVTGRESFSGNNEGFSGNNEGFSGKNDIKKRKENKRKGKENIYTPSASDIWIDHPDVNAAFIRYILFRAGGGSFPRQQAEALRDQILAMSQDPAKQVKIIDQSTRAGWKEFYPLGERRGSGSGFGSGRKNKPDFRNFEQRTYDFRELERQLLSQQLGGGGS